MRQAALALAAGLALLPAGRVWAADAPDQAARCARATLDHEGIAALQQALTQLGQEAPGPVDGICGPATLAAILAFQRGHGLPPDGAATPELLAAVQAAGRPAGTAPKFEGGIEAPPAVTLAEPEPTQPPQYVAPADKMMLPDLDPGSAHINPAPPASILPNTVDPVTGRPRLF